MQIPCFDCTNPCCLLWPWEVGKDRDRCVFRCSVYWDLLPFVLCVTVWELSVWSSGHALTEGQCLGRGHWSHGSKHRVLCLREAFCYHVWMEGRPGVTQFLTKSSLHSKGNCANSQELVLFFRLSGLYWSVPKKRWKGSPHLDAGNLPRRRVSCHFLIFLRRWSKRVSWDSNKAKSTVPLIIGSQSTGVGIQLQQSGPWF